MYRMFLVFVCPKMFVVVYGVLLFDYVYVLLDVCYDVVLPFIVCSCVSSCCFFFMCRALVCVMILYVDYVLLLLLSYSYYGSLLRRRTNQSPTKLRGKKHIKFKTTCIRN